MIGVIIAGHGDLASEIISTAESVMGKQKYLEAVSVKVGFPSGDTHGIAITAS